MHEKTFHDKVAFINFIFSLLVIWTHSYNAELFLYGSASYTQSSRIELFFTERLGQIAVPGFFMLSSYLFFRNYSHKKIISKWSGRIRSVLLPYILWNAIYYLGYITASRLPWISDVVGKGLIPLTFEELKNALLFYKYNYVFWFLYQLIILILLSPLIYGIVQSNIAALIYFPVLSALIYLKLHIPYLNADALFYYSLAAYISVHHSTIAENQTSKHRIISIAAGILAALAASGCLGLTMKYSNVLLIVLSRAMGVVSVWLICIPVKLPAFLPAPFFVYAIHFAIVRFVNKGTMSLLSALSLRHGINLLLYANYIALGLFFAMPLTVLALSALISGFMKKNLPTVYSVLSGGR